MVDVARAYERASSEHEALSRRMRRRWPFAPRAAGASCCGPRHERNEDRFALPDDVPVSLALRHGWLFAVADGVGGSSGGAAASAIACAALFDRFYSTQDGADLPGRLTAAIDAADVAVRASRPDQDGAAASAPASTLVACVIRRGAVWVAHVGDSRLYRVRDGVAEALTQDHTTVAALLAKGVISYEEAAVHPQRHALSRALGAGDAFPELAQVDVQPGDQLVLMTDGISGHCAPDTIAKTVDDQPPTRAVASLLGAVLRAGQTDDATAMVVEPIGRGPTVLSVLRPAFFSVPRAGALVALLLVAMGVAAGVARDQARHRLAGPRCIGDVNEDGRVDAADVTLLNDARSPSEPGTESVPDPRMDLNGDGTVDQLDITIIASHIAKCVEPSEPNPGASP